MSAVLKLARALSVLSSEEFKTAVSFAKELAGHGGKSAPAKKTKRKYTRKAKAVEVAPGVSVVKRGRKKKALSGEIDHSPRSVEDQVR